MALRIDLSVHGAAELLLGLATMVLPFATGAGPAGIVVGIVLGALVVGVSFGALDPQGSVGLHHAADNALALALAVAAAVLALAAQPAAAVVLGAAAVVQAALVFVTRYSAA